MGVTTGIDARGRPYRMVNGRRVNAAGGKGKSRDLITKSHVIAAPKDAVRRLMQRWFGKAKSGREVPASISQLLKTKFNLWFRITAQTQVGRQGRLYAMREILKRLKDDVDPKTFVTADKQLNYPKFIEYLKTKHGVEVPPEEGEGETPPPSSPSDDAQILKIVHAAGLNATRLAAIIADSKPDDSVRSGDKEPRPER